jgi:flagellar motility protein MotE (MotC chaperone)
MNGYQNYFKRRSEIFKKKTSPKKKLRVHQGWLMTVAFVLTAGVAGYLFTGDEATKFLNRVEIGIMGEAMAETAAKPKTAPAQDKAAADKAKDGEKKSADGAKETAEASAAPKSWSTEEVTLFTKLEARKKELDAKETELNNLEEELHKQKEDLEKRLATLEEVRQKIAAKLEDKVKVDQQRVDTLVSVYANMKPVQAAKVIEGLNEDLAVEILAKMKNKSAAEILNLMDSEKAKKISERFAGYRDPAIAGR